MTQTVLYIDGNLLSYAEYGDKNGYPILVQHGLIASIRDYGIFERLIQLGTRLICMARPGYGESSPYVMGSIAEWADIAAVLIDELKLSRFDVLGMSSGAPYSYSIGYRYPDRVRNIYIFSGIPALYDDEVQSRWPYPVTKDASIAEMQKLARELFFPNLSEEDLEKDDVRDSMMNNCFGIAQDLKLRCMDWGFSLSDVKGHVYMQHSRSDSAVPLSTAMITANMLPNCRLEIKESGVHFSNEALDEFIRTTMAGYY
jgi:pimeloyl-ACP methyl ester carboxylesterase